MKSKRVIYERIASCHVCVKKKEKNRKELNHKKLHNVVIRVINPNNYLNLVESKTAPLLLTRSIVNFSTANKVRTSM